MPKSVAHMIENGPTFDLRSTVRIFSYPLTYEGALSLLYKALSVARDIPLDQGDDPELDDDLVLGDFEIHENDILDWFLNTFNGDNFQPIFVPAPAVELGLRILVPDQSYLRALQPLVRFSETGDDGAELVFSIAQTEALVAWGHNTLVPLVEKSFLRWLDQERKRRVKVIKAVKKQGPGFDLKKIESALATLREVKGTVVKLPGDVSRMLLDAKNSSKKKGKPKARTAK